MIEQNKRCGLDPIYLAKQLIAFPSVTPDNTGAIDFIYEVLTSLGFTSEILYFGDNQKVRIKNLYSQLNKDSPNLCFAGHTDVVPPGDLNKWISSPFEPKIIDGILYGRGVVDMKASISAFIAAVSSFSDSNFNGSISFIITADEEGVNYAYGTKSVLNWLRNNKKKIDYCIVGEPTSSRVLGDVVKIGRRGSINFELKCFGTQGHVAYPEFAYNPIDNMIDILFKIKNMVLDMGNQYFQPSNCEIVMIDVHNNNYNVIPDLVTSRFNIRYNTEHSSDSLIKIIDNICCNVTQRYTLSTTISGEAFISDSHKYTDIFLSSIKKCTGIDAKTSTSGGTSDSRFIKDFCPVIEFGLLNETAHKINESSSVNDIYKLTDIYREFMKHFFSI